MISHHFSNHKIEGLTVADELGISFSYEREHPKVKQNFTLCHELGILCLNMMEIISQNLLIIKRIC